MLDELGMFSRFARGLRRFLATPLSPEDCRRFLAERLAAREQSFLLLAERAIFANPRSPYLPLFRWAGVQFGDLEQSVRKDGLEATLARLLDSGVHVTLDEFKGRKPIRRAGFEWPVGAADFDNPLLEGGFLAQTGGSTGAPRRLLVDLALLTHDAAAQGCFMQSCGILEWPTALWRPVPPGGAGIKRVLQHSKLGRPAMRWFSQTEPGWKRGRMQSHLFLAGALRLSRGSSYPLPAPEHVPISAAAAIARWLAEMKSKGQPVHFDTNVASGVRVCHAVREAGLDIEGTFFRVGGEPLTPSRQRLFTELGCRVACHYSMGECGPVGIACASPTAADDTHLLASKVALISHPRPGLPVEFDVEPFYLTTVLPACPKLMLNVETGDYGAIERRSCGCGLDELGFATHIHNIRSYEKLTSEGMHFLGSEFLTLVDEVLPKAFGGMPTDYQFVEREENGLPRIDILVSSRVGLLNDGAVIAAVVEFLGAQSRVHRMMAERWRDGGTLGVVRREPYMTGRSKVLPLHVMRG